MNGVLIINKSGGYTSHDVVNRVRRILNELSVGHLGTLDPLATGVLPLVLGSMTRLAQFYAGSEKTYEGTIRFGFATNTYDSDGEPSTPPEVVSLSLPELRRLALSFQGVIAQTPPPFSAKKIHGVPAYKLARKKQKVEIQPVRIEVKALEILTLNADRATFRARVAAGTYMRSIAHDMGHQLGCGAHLEQLCRTAFSHFSLPESHTLEELQSAADHNRAAEMLIHPRKLLPHMPSVTVPDDVAGRIRHGASVNLLDLSKAPQVKVFHGQTELIAIATRIAGTLFHAKTVFAETRSPLASSS